MPIKLSYFTRPEPVAETFQEETSPTLEESFWNDIKDILRGTNSSNKMAKALQDYIRLVDKMSDRPVNSRSRPDVIKVNSKNRLAASIANTHGLSPRKFLEYINNTGKKIGLDSSYMFEDVNDAFEVEMIAESLKPLDVLAKKIWYTDDIEKKRAIASELIDKMIPDHKKGDYLERIKYITNGETINQMVANLGIVSTEPLVALGLAEEVITEMSTTEVSSVERDIASKWKQRGVKFDFSRHFMDRVNDKRNNPPISQDELHTFFLRVFEKLGKKIGNIRMRPGEDMEGVFSIRSMALHVPFVIRYEKDQGNGLILLAQTILRKKKFALGRMGGKHFVVEDTGDVFMEMYGGRTVKIKWKYKDPDNKKLYKVDAVSVKKARDAIQKKLGKQVSLNAIRMDEEHGAGFWGTNELTKKYASETPGQENADIPSSGNKYVEKFDNDGVDPGPVKKEKKKALTTEGRVAPTRGPKTTSFNQFLDIGKRSSVNRDSKSDARRPVVQRSRKSGSLNTQADRDRKQLARKDQQAASKERAKTNSTATAPGNRPSPKSGADLMKSIDKQPQRNAQKNNTQAQRGMAQARTSGAKAQQAKVQARNDSRKAADALANKTRVRRPAVAQDPVTARPQGIKKHSQVTARPATKPKLAGASASGTPGSAPKTSKPVKKGPITVPGSVRPSSVQPTAPKPKAKPAITKIAKRPKTTKTKTVFKANFKGGFGQKAVSRFNSKSNERRPGNSLK
jgi:hypothetical protein